MKQYRASLNQMLFYLLQEAHYEVENPFRDLFNSCK